MSTSNEIEELKKADLLIAKETCLSLCTLEYNMFLFTLEGEEIQAYIKHWKKRIQAAKKMIKASTTVEAAFRIFDEFDSELLNYVKAAKVDTADKAMEIAHSFIKKYVPVALPLKAVRQDDVWLVDIDVGALAVKVAKVKVDARTGDILSYEIPEKK